MKKIDDPDMAGAKSTLITTPRLEAKISDNLPPVKYDSFLEYPFEIRAMIYKDFFAAEFCESYEGKEELGQSPSNGVGSMLVTDSDEKEEDWEDVWEEAPEEDKMQIHRRMTAHDKVALLLANKAILEEALPFFHRLHEFQLLLLEQYQDILTTSPHLPRHIKQVLGVITKVRMVNRHAEDTEEPYLFYHSVPYYIAFLRSMCTNLRSLTIDFELSDDDDYSDAVDELQQLWPRLDYLQLVIKYQYSGDVEYILRSIALGLKWSHYREDNDRSVDSQNQQFSRRRVCSLDRTCLEKGVTKIKDEESPALEDGPSTDLGDDYGSDLDRAIFGFSDEDDYDWGL